MSVNKVLLIAAIIVFIVAALPVGLPQLTLVCIGLALWAGSQVT